MLSARIRPSRYQMTGMKRLEPGRVADLGILAHERKLVSDRKKTHAPLLATPPSSLPVRPTAVRSSRALAAW